MSSTEKSSSAATGPDDPSLSGPAGGANPVLPELRTALVPSEVLARLLALAKRGKLSGYEALGAHPTRSAGAAFKVSARGEPYDRELIASVVPDVGGGGGSVIRFESRLLKRLPAVVIVLTALSIQPGLWLTDSMLRLYFPWYRIETWWWYLPLVLLSVPMLWKQYRKSEAAASAEAARVAADIAAALK